MKKPELCVRCRKRKRQHGKKLCTFCQGSSKSKRPPKSPWEDAMSRRLPGLFESGR